VACQHLFQVLDTHAAGRQLGFQVTGGAVAAARWFGTTGVALAYLAVMSTVMLGGGHVIFLRKRAQWQVPRP